MVSHDNIYYTADLTWIYISKSLLINMGVLLRKNIYIYVIDDKAA